MHQENLVVISNGSKKNVELEVDSTAMDDAIEAFGKKYGVDVMMSNIGKWLLITTTGIKADESVMEVENLGKVLIKPFKNNLE